MDEIDAIGGRRFSEGTSADREIQRTLMELLNQLDGFDELGKVNFIVYVDICSYSFLGILIQAANTSVSTKVLHSTFGTRFCEVNPICLIRSMIEQCCLIMKLYFNDCDVPNGTLSVCCFIICVH
jgi:hypothetical protein